MEPIKIMTFAEFVASKTKQPEEAKPESTEDKAEETEETKPESTEDKKEGTEEVEEAKTATVSKELDKSMTAFYDAQLALQKAQKAFIEIPKEKIADREKAKNEVIKLSKDLKGKEQEFQRVLNAEDQELEIDENLQIDNKTEETTNEASTETKEENSTETKEEKSEE